MAHTSEKILSLLPLLDEQIADDLETETLDFKECPIETKLRELAKEMAICLGNASVAQLFSAFVSESSAVIRPLSGLTSRQTWSR